MGETERKPKTTIQVDPSVHKMVLARKERYEKIRHPLPVNHDALQVEFVRLFDKEYGRG